jgi:hypothetical protein
MRADCSGDLHDDAGRFFARLAPVENQPSGLQPFPQAWRGLARFGQYRVP